MCSKSEYLLSLSEPLDATLFVRDALLFDAASVACDAFGCVCRGCCWWWLFDGRVLVVV